MKFSLITLCLALLGAPATAQSISAADLKAQIDARVGGLNEYQELLNDPDPARSMAAMEIMLASGDAALVSMAKEYGIFSPNAAVRKAALDGFFASGPVLEFQFDGGKVAKLQNFNPDLKWYAGSVSADSIGYAQVQIGTWDNKKQCFSGVGMDNDSDLNANGCFLRNSENGVGLYLWKKWWRLTLNDQGALIGSGDSRYNRSLPVSIQVAQ